MKKSHPTTRSQVLDTVQHMEADVFLPVQNLIFFV